MVIDTIYCIYYLCNVYIQIRAKIRLLFAIQNRKDLQMLYFRNNKSVKVLKFDIYIIVWSILGVELGDTKLVFTVAGNDEEVTSAPMDLQVFQPLKLFPRNGTVLIGASIQLVVKGGPQPDAEIVFTVADNRTASMDFSLSFFGCLAQVNLV